MCWLAVLALVFASVTAGAELKCPANSYKRVDCRLKPQMSNKTMASVTQVVVCQVDAAEAVIVYPTASRSLDILPADLYRLNTGLERFVGGLTRYGGALEITTFSVSNGTRSGSMPAYIKLAGERLEADCTVDKTLQTFHRQTAHFPPAR